MGYVKIEMVTSNNKRFAFEMETEGLYKINSLSGLPIESLDKIYEICIFYDLLVITTEDRDFRCGSQPYPFIKNDRSENNVLAFDFHGNFLWNIGSIVGDIKMAFDSVTCVLKTEAEKEYGIEITSDTEILLRCIALGFTFIIDPVNKKLLYRVAGKVK